MSKLIETMESRVLFSAAPTVIAADLSAAKTAATTAKANLTAVLTTVTAEVKALTKEVAAAHPVKSQKLALSAVEKAEAVAAAKFKQKISSILATGLLDGARLESQLISLEKHPTSVAVEKKVGAALTKLENVFSDTVITTLETNAAAAVSGVDADLNALAASVPATQSQVSLTESGLSGDLGTLSTDAAGIQAVVGKLAVDVG